MDSALRNSLWNYFYTRMYNNSNLLLHDINDNFFKYRHVELSSNSIYAKRLIDSFYNFFKEAEWYRIYDFLEFLLGSSNINIKTVHIKHINIILESEMAGYRIIGNVISRITDETELDSIEMARQNKSVAIHIQNALSLLSDREKPDFRNSIKESISAVEAVCRIITGESTLGQALASIEKKDTVHFNKQFKNGLEQIYAYTNNPKTGIRHALLDDTHDISFEDAKFMLVLCSAFVNYLAVKAT